jgi:hypothetical protein
MTDWSGLETAGFVVVRGFLDEPTLDVLRADFAGGAPPTSFPHGFKLIGRRALAAAWARIEPACAEIRARTRIAVDVMNFLTLSHYITTALAERTSYFHQDFDLDYKLSRDHVNYLNFWIPITKPEQARSNVTVVGFDALQARSQAAYELANEGGGKRYIPTGGRTDVFGAYGEILGAEPQRPEHELDFDLATVATTPALDAGDLLLMRGDIVHRTQDSDTLRIAASLRVTSSTKRLHRKYLGEAGEGAAARMHAMIDRCFAAHARDEVTVAELAAFADGRG